MAKDVNNIIYKVQVDATSGKISIDGVTKSFEQADKAFLKLRNDVAKGLPKATKEVNNLRSASGGATTSVLELGRVVSDAPYGIRGMANNVSQLASNMLFTSQQIDKTTGKAIGFKGVLKDMGKSFMGPLGVLFAIQAVVAAVDYFYGGATKAAGAGKEFELSAKDLSGTLRDLHGTQEDVNDKIDEYITLMMKKRLVAKEDAESNKEIAKLDKVIEDAKAIMFNNDVERLGGAERLTKQQIALANKTYNAQKEILEKAENDRVEEFKRVIKRQQEIEDLDKKMKAAEEGSLKSLKNLKKEKEKERELMSKTSEDYKRLTIAIDDYQKKIEDIEGRKKKGRKSTILQTPEEFEADALSLQSEIDSWSKKMLMAATKDKDQILQLELVFYKKKQEARRKDREDEAFEELFSYEDKLDRLVKSGKMEAGEAQMASVIARAKTKEKVDGINSEHDRLIAKAKEATDALRLGLGEDEAGVDNTYSFAEAAEQYKILSASITSFLDGEYQRQLTIEQNKTNGMNNELRERLNNENLSKAQRKNIQLEIARNDEELRKKQEKIAKKRFKMQKAINIANALVDTYKNGVSAYGSQLMIGDLSSPLRAQIAQGVAIASGLANVAMIARQKFQSTAGGAPSAGALGGGGSGGNDRSFNFNLAGASRENQLADTLQGRFNQPLQAYVVSRDITNQQQLDEEITSSASFG